MLQNQQIQSRRYVLRAYVTADNGSYAVMPGGLTRVTGSDTSLVVSLQHGGGTKDTWILGDRPGKRSQPAHAGVAAAGNQSR